MRVLALGALGVILLLIMCFIEPANSSAQSSPPPPPSETDAAKAKEVESLRLSEVQSLKLQVRQRDALLAKAALDNAQTNLQNAVQQLQAEADHIKSDNKMPKEAVFDMNSLSFSVPAPPPPPAKVK